MITSIDIGIEIDFVKFLISRGLFHASSGGGKSYLLRKFAESVGNRMQQILIDREGEFVTLREKFDFALVSKEGDIPLSVKYAETLAHKILETNISVIIDLYDLPPHEKIKFVYLFSTALINAPKRLWHPSLIYLDEADTFAPEGKSCESTQAVINLCALSRKRGFCPILATQRLPKLSKDATSELLNKFIGRAGQDIDRKRYGDELGFTNKEDFFKLRALNPGEFYTVGPITDYEVKKFKVKKVITTHPEPGSLIIASPPTPNAIKKILKRLADIPQEAERELKTREDLEREVFRLRGDLKKQTGGGANLDRSGEVLSLKTEVRGLKDDLVSIKKTLQSQKEAFKRVSITIGPFLGEISSSDVPAVVSVAARTEMPATLPVRPNIPSTSGLAPGPHKMLVVLAMRAGEAVSRKKLSMLSGYSLTSSTFGIYIGKLKEKGYVQSRGKDLIITEDGCQAVGAFEPLPNDPASLISYWSKFLEPGPSKMFQILAACFPDSMSKQELSEQSGYSLTSSTFGIYVGKLKTLQLVDETNKRLSATDSIFNN